MKLTAILPQLQLRRFFAGLDKQGLVYQFNVSYVEDDAIHLLCSVDGTDYDGVTVLLRADGTWETIVDVKTGESK